MRFVMKESPFKSMAFQFVVETLLHSMYVNCDHITIGYTFQSN